MFPDHAPLSSIPHQSLRALRAALVRDLGDQFAGPLQEAGFAGGATVLEAFGAWCAQQGLGAPADLPMATFRELLQSTKAQIREVSPAEAEDVRPAQITKIIEILATEFEFVILDTPAGLDELTLTAMESATDLLLVCGTDVASMGSNLSTEPPLKKIRVS